MTHQNKTSVPELKTCPFCGCLAWAHTKPVFKGEIGHRIECEGLCHAMTCWWHSLKEAIENWNRRVV